MEERHRVKLSKYLSRVLRHEPSMAGVTLDDGGWVDIDVLLTGAARSGKNIPREALMEVIATSDKKRFTLSPDQRRVRAAQGHSIPVDLGLVAAAPPEVLWHGTAEGTVAAIQREGLKLGRRQHVHLSIDRETAKRVGQRHGRPRIFEVHAAPAHRDGQPLWQADNGVWLTEPLPPKYLVLLPKE